MASKVEELEGKVTAAEQAAEETIESTKQQAADAEAAAALESQQALADAEQEKAKALEEAKAETDRATAEAETASKESAAALEKVQAELDAIKAEKSTEDVQLAETSEELAKVKAGLQGELDIAANALRGQLASSAQVQEDMQAVHAAEMAALETRVAEAEKINMLHKEKSMREHVGGTLGGQFGATLEAMHSKEIKEHKNEIETHKKEIVTLRDLHMMTNRFAACCVACCV
mmetsp:Transcript_4996/g.10916  ORF Transcript_4996/g.10916 Transcript_4996/m.10916 type:complete len:232 (+) Transcript_4996:698-1393(+)